METQRRGKVFDYRTLRLLVGLIALLMPFVVTLVSSRPLRSISDSYYTEARDLFVGMLFVVGTFLLAYNGHTSTQAVLSRLAGFAAITAALSPTACHLCSMNAAAVIHYVAATVLLGILAWFCLVPFQTKLKREKGKKRLRSVIYYTCGGMMVVCLLTALVARFTMSTQAVYKLRIIYWAEATSLVAFGVAWFVAAKWLRPFTDEKDRLRLFTR